jgi:hypothetical protein
MPTTERDIIGSLFRQHPAFAAELLSRLRGIPVPPFDEARSESIEVTDLKPAPYAADAAVALVIRKAVPVPGQRVRRRRRPQHDCAVGGIVVEVQRSTEPSKRPTWPVYATRFSARLGGCPVMLLVIATSERVARWASKPIKFSEPWGYLRPVVIGPGSVPAITDPDQARQHPELAVLSARIHGNTRQAGAVFRALQVALADIDPNDAQLYYDLLLDGLEPWAQDIFKELTTVTAVIPNDPRAVNLRRWLEGATAEAHAQGEARGKARAVVAVLAARGVEIPDHVRERISCCTDLGQLDTWIRRAATARTVKELFE